MAFIVVGRVVVDGAKKVEDSQLGPALFALGVGIKEEGEAEHKGYSCLKIRISE